MAISGIYARAHRETILFADADSNTRFAYQAVASVAGFVVELARDGYEALTLANLVVPDVVVLDTLLPGHDGFEVIRRLRASDRTRSIPILIVSSEDGALFEAAVRRSGCQGHLIKPCTASELMRLVTVRSIERRCATSEAALELASEARSAV